MAVTDRGVVVYVQNQMLWAWDPAADDRWPLLGAFRGGIATISPDDRELALYGSRRGLQFVSLERPPELGPEDALTEVITLEPAKLR